MEKKYTIWQSLAWHFTSRKSRLALIALIALVLTQVEFFGLTPEAASVLATNITVVATSLILALAYSKKRQEDDGKQSLQDVILAELTKPEGE